MGIDLKDVEQNWKLHWSGEGPFDVNLMDNFHDKWVRFHTLPESKRYPETDEELKVIIGRHNTLLEELHPGKRLVLITTQWSNLPADSKLRINVLDPESTHWRTVFESPDETDPEFFTYRYYYASEKRWVQGTLDTVLSDVANDKTSGVIIAPTDMRWLYHPYDGGADIYCETLEQRDKLKAHHKDWLSAHPRGM